MILKDFGQGSSMSNASGNDLAHFVHLNLFDCLKQQLCLYPSKTQDLYSQTKIISGIYYSSENEMVSRL